MPILNRIDRVVKGICLDSKVDSGMTAFELYFKLGAQEIAFRYRYLFVSDWCFLSHDYVVAHIYEPWGRGLKLEA